jgi:hypothetical protein
MSTSDASLARQRRDVNNQTNSISTHTINDDEDEEWWNEDDNPILASDDQPSVARLTRWPNFAGATDEHIAQNPRRSTRRRTYSVVKPVREKSKQKQKMKNAAAGIKVITNVSRHHGPEPVVAQPPMPQPPQPVTQARGFVDLAALQALDTQAPESAGGFWKSIKGNKSSKPVAADHHTIARGSNGAAPVAAGSGLAPVQPRPSTDLSPSDRPIFIGISIDDSIPRPPPSPKSVSSRVSTEIDASDTTTPKDPFPETPTIIITPSQEDPAAWYRQEEQSPYHTRPRATSSLYSRATNFFPPSNNPTDAPPVPKIPVSAFRKSLGRGKSRKSVRVSAATVFSEDGDLGSARRSRALSSATVFEEDESPILTRQERALSESASGTAIKHTSVLLPDQRASKGWWNYITTPFLTRAPTLPSPSGTQHERLALPKPTATSPEAAKRFWEKSYFSPMSPETSTTIASDAWWDAQGAKLGRRSTIKSPEAEAGTLQTDGSGTLPFVLAAGEATYRNMDGEITNGMIQTVPEPVPTMPPHILQTAIPNAASPPVAGFTAPTTTKALPPPPPASPLQAIANGAGRTIDPPLPIRGPIMGGGLGGNTISSRQLALPYSPGPPPYSPPRVVIPKYHAILPATLSRTREPVSPGPVTPSMQRAMTTGGGIALSDVPSPETQAPRRVINLNGGYPDLPTRQHHTPVTIGDIVKQSKKATKAEAKRQRNEKEDALVHTMGGLWRGRGCLPKRGCYGRGGAEGRKRRRCWFWLIAGFLSMIILIVVLATTLHRSPPPTTVPSQWVNLTGFPPIYTGVSTVAVPDNTVAVVGCMQPSTMWSCSLPKELQQSADTANEPNFRLQIQWDNSSSTNATFSNVTGNPNLPTRSINSPAAYAHHIVRRILLRARQSRTFTPTPAPPSLAEQVFLGNTTDGIISAAKAGEPTPFYISFLSTDDMPDTVLTNTNTRHVTPRANSNSTATFPDILGALPSVHPPPVSADGDGTAAPANLLPLPLPAQQPLRLYDRGLASEHYGFYTYFNRSIYSKAAIHFDSPVLGDGQPIPDDANGGCTRTAAQSVCTWSETRFLVQIWTRRGNSSVLLGSGSGSSSSSASSSPNSTANDFSRPGSFPLPVTISIDRHGGDPARKALYCWGLDAREAFNTSLGKIYAGEQRGFGGTLINPTPNAFNVSLPGQGRTDVGAGGFDGGTGGCRCVWGNWKAVS